MSAIEHSKPRAESVRLRQATHAHLYEHYGWTLIPDVCSADEALRIEQRTLDIVDDVGIFKEGTATGGGHSKYWILDGFCVQASFPELVNWYGEQRPIIEGIVGRQIILSPYPRSAINIKIYRGSGSGQGWHYDTNPVSAVLYLSDRGAPLALRDLQGGTFGIPPQPGMLLLMQGREVFHRVMEGDETRASCVLNYYHPDDCERPEWIDRVIYENEEPPRLA